MRLNQLAKKVGKPYTRVEKFLVKECGMEGIEGPNTKVNDELIDKVIYKFGLAEDNKEAAPKRVVLETIEAVEANIKPEETGLQESDFKLKPPTPAEAVKPRIEIEDIKIDVQEEVITESEEVEEEPQNIEETIPQVESNEPEIIKPESAVEEESLTQIETGETVLHLDKDGVIKAPKVALEGIKVMGKIDLPQPKVVEVAPKEEGEELKAENAEDNTEPVIEETPKPISKPKKAKPSQDDIDARRAKRIAAQKKAENEAFEKELAEKKKKEKEAKRLHYLEQMKEVAQENKAPKAKKKKTPKASPAQEKFDTKHKYENVEDLTTWQKIVKWFNT